MADQGGGGSSLMRDYRKGNWTVSETMILIEAKRMDDERRMRWTSDSEGRGRPAELRWKWVEDYCWRKGCRRSQNQCNDKWDNLMRDYKKVRDYERRLAEKRAEGNTGSGSGGDGSYWQLEKNERKERSLPSNMLVQIYDALVEVVERRGGEGGTGLSAHQRVLASGGSGTSTPPDPNLISYMVERPINNAVQFPLPPLLQHQVPAPVPTPTPVLTLPAPLPPPLPTQPSHGQVPTAIPFPQPSPPVDSDNTSNEYSDSPAKRRRRGGGGGGGEGTSTGGGTASGSTSHEVGNAISRSASIIAEAIQAYDDREERRHRDLMALHEKRLRIEESKVEISSEGINGLVEAINNLASSILALSSHRNQSASN